MGNTRKERERDRRETEREGEREPCGPSQLRMSSTRAFFALCLFLSLIFLCSLPLSLPPSLFSLSRSRSLSLSLSLQLISQQARSLNTTSSPSSLSPTTRGGGGGGET